MRIARWVFVDRRTGRVVVMQMPNIPLGVFLVATIASRVLSATAASSVLAVIATGALVVWAADEIARGVNPWRRALGAAVLLATIVSILHR